MGSTSTKRSEGHCCSMAGNNRLALAHMGGGVPGLGLSRILRGMLAKLWDSLV